MSSLRDKPIKTKLTAIAMVTSGVALLLACAAFVGYELMVFRTDIVDELSTTAAIVGDNSAAALAFDDPASAQQTLRSLNVRPHIVGAALTGTPVPAGEEVAVRHLDHAASVVVEVIQGKDQPARRLCSRRSGAG